jgi:group I intron endonuclease
MLDKMPTEDNRIHYIYCATNLINNKLYIGQTVNPSNRWSHHKYSIKNKNKLFFTKSILKYGANNFKYEVIEQHIGKKDTDDAEEFWIYFFQSYKREFGYNLRIGGDVSCGWRHTEETKKKISMVLKSRKPEDKQRTKELLKSISKGKHYSPITQFKPGHKLSEHSIKKLSESLLGNIPWNKNTFGIMRPNKTSFKPGNISWSQGTKGKTKNQSKLNEKDVLYIYKSFYSKLKNKKELAEQYNISKTVISKITNGRTFKEITKHTSKYTKNNSKLNKEDILKIIDLYNKSINIKEICKLYDIKERVIYRITSGLSFSEITRIKYFGKDKRKFKIDKIGTYDI